MNWQAEALLALRAGLAALLGAVIGIQRERSGHEAGIRTHAEVALGACVFSLVSYYVFGLHEAHIPAQVVTGVGFIGAGVILREQGKIKGLTTAAGLWSTASVGVASGYGMYVLSLLVTIIILLVLAIPVKKRWDESKPSVKISSS